jgi:hypothetical protein
MKLTSAQVDRVLDQFDGDVIPPDSPSMPELESVFGPHTFFVGRTGLHLVEQSTSTNSVKHPAFVVRVAIWSEVDPSSLLPLSPEVIVAVDLSDADRSNPPR